MVQWLLIQLFSPLTAMLATTWGLGVACIVVWFLAPAWLPFNRSHILWLGVALISGGMFYWWAFHAGEAHMTQLIAAADKAAFERVEKKLKDLDACPGGRANWDVVTARCK